MTMNSNDERKVVDTKLSIHPEIEDRLSDFQKECLEDEISELPSIREGEVDITTDFIFDMEDNYETSIFIRNGLQQDLMLQYVPFIIVDSEEKILARKLFDLREAGNIPPHGVRPWKIYFSKDEVDLEGQDLTKLKLVFEKKLKAETIVTVEYENLPKKISMENKEKYTKFLKSLPLLKKGKFTMSTYEVVKTDDGGISVTIVIRNGYDKGIRVKKVPITILDATGEIAAAGIFYLDNVIISPLKARIYSFTFSKNEINKARANLSKWKVNFTMTNTISTGDEKKDEQ
ncbi:SLAP domain-containing protein [Clostridium ganghwense]|uniref:SLAP domain-containing protein n=1 Tax=Clostridium ganghwense TaxID=312089 RepID=A0ABT4CPI3_9CLOT|nr:SLAP domain-containing protein [Clostridium ganghwense]MCY6370969.1 SLAP domain-containing protein [Clostridium ganghwense]